MASARKSSAKKSSAKKKKKSSARKSVAKKKTARKAASKKSAAKKRTARTPAAKKRASKKRAKARKRTSAAPKKASSAKSPFPKKFLDAQHQALLDERATYERQALSLKAEADSLVADLEPGDVQFDEESGEGDTLQVERERDLALSAQAQQAITEIDHALAKFENGTYGICEVSGEPIPEERLDAIPWARERVEYKVGGITRR